MSRVGLAGVFLAAGSCAAFAWVVEPGTPQARPDPPAASQIEELVGYLALCPELADQLAVPLDANQGLLPPASVRRFRTEGRACLAQRAELAEVHRYRLAMAALREQLADSGPERVRDASGLRLSWSLEESGAPGRAQEGRGRSASGK